MNYLENYFKKNDKRLIHKWVHYFDVYDRHFSKYRNREIIILEIGVSQGGSLQMWKEYFGEKAKIFGIDIDPRCKELEEKNVKIFIGSQSDRNFLREVKKNIPPIDILIDDGGHKMTQQIISYEELFDYIKDDGIYVCEDLHTSYWLKYGGGYKRRGTFIEFSKNLIDYLNAYHSEQKSLKISNFTKTVDSIHYYDSMIIIEKRKRESPYSEKSGHLSFQEYSPKSSYSKMAIQNIRVRLLYMINIFLRLLRLKSFRW